MPKLLVGKSLGCQTKQLKQNDRIGSKEFAAVRECRTTETIIAAPLVVVAVVVGVIVSAIVGVGAGVATRRVDPIGITASRVVVRVVV